MQAQQKIKAIYEWEGCDENSEIFQKVASVLDSEFEMERTAKRKKRRLTSTARTTTELSDVEYAHDSDNNSSSAASASESDDDASQEDAYESSFIDDEEDEHDSDSQCSWTCEQDDADAADSTYSADSTNNASDGELCTDNSEHSTNTHTAKERGTLAQQVTVNSFFSQAHESLLQDDDVELPLFAPQELFSAEELSHSMLPDIDTNVSGFVDSDIIPPAYSCDQTESAGVE